MLTNWQRRVFMFFDTLVQTAVCETNITCIAQVTFKFVDKALLVHNRQLSFMQFEILFNLLADKYGLYGCVDLLTQIFKFSTYNVSLGLIFKRYENTNVVWTITVSR